MRARRQRCLSRGDGWRAIVLSACVCLCPRTRRFVADFANHRIRQIVASTGVVTTLAGSTYGYVDATGTSAKFSYPVDLAVTSDGAKV